MKVKLAVSEECYDNVKTFLINHNIEIDEDAEFILMQRDKYPEYMSVRDSESGNRRNISVEDIITIESYGHTVEVHTDKRVFTTSERLYQLMNTLDPHKFIRISNSVIIAKSKVTEIIPAFSMKFTLKMVNGDKVDVTRSYYSNFRDTFNV